MILDGKILASVHHFIDLDSLLHRILAFTALISTHDPGDQFKVTV